LLAALHAAGTPEAILGPLTEIIGAE
jgi:hypothetical protein